MSVSKPLSQPSPAGVATEGVHDVFVARQPIFDARDRLFAYELLYRSSAQQNWASGATPDQMCTDTVIHSVLSIGLDRLTGGAVSFVNLTRELLMRGLYELFDPRTVVVELLETVEPDEEVIAACERLVAAGYRLALDDFVYSPAYEPLLALASVIKVDVLDREESELEALASRLKQFDVRLLAERVETAAVRDSCRAMGFDLFQGYYYSRPEILSKRELSIEQATMVRLMNLLTDDSQAETAIEDAFRSDPSLSYKLLRIVNSAAFGGREIESISFALRLLGRTSLHQWLTILLVSTVGTQSGVSRELVKVALVRARFCELIGLKQRKRDQAGSLFLVGMFSMLDVLMQMPMEEIVVRMALGHDVRNALLRREGPLAPTLGLAVAYDSADWNEARAAADAVGVPLDQIAVLYADSLAWARERLSST
jgi:EAL and modified HD-GYP domain-containing signal transduction protein